LEIAIIGQQKDSVNDCQGVVRKFAANNNVHGRRPLCVVRGDPNIIRNKRNNNPTFTLTYLRI